MKCTKCDKNERSGTSSFCNPCRAKAAKERRAAYGKFLLERPKPTEPISDLNYVPVDPQVKEELVVPLMPSTTYQPSPIYWSAYVIKDSEIYHKFKAIEAQYITS